MATGHLCKVREVEELDAGRGRLTDLLKRLQGEPIRDPEQATRVILQTIRAMTERLPQEKGAGSEYLIVVGLTGAGKSTLSNWLLGQGITVDKVTDEDGEAVPTIRCPTEVHKIGRDDSVSQTFLPQISPLGNGRFLVDFPGFFDTGGDEVRIGMDLAFREWVNRLGPVRVLFLVPVALVEGKGSLVTQQLRKLARLLPLYGCPVSQTDRATRENCSTWVVGITKCDENFVTTPIKKFKQAKQFIQAFGKEVDIPVLNINAVMFKGVTAEGQPMSRQDFVNFLIANARTPNAPLTSDCLASQDVKNYAVGFATFAETMWDRISKDIHRSGGAVEPDAAALISKLEKAIEDGSRPYAVWEELLALTGQYLAQLDALTGYIAKRSEGMIADGTLIVERESQPIFQLRQYGQCRLKDCLLVVEDKLLDSIAPPLEAWRSTILETMENLHQHAFIRSSDFEKFQAVFKTQSDHMDEEARRLGYESAGALAAKSKWIKGLLVGSGVAAAVGTGAVVWHVVAGSSFAAWWAGTGTLSIAALGAISGGVVIGIVALAGLGRAVYHLARHWGDEYSDKLTNLYIDAICQVARAWAASCRHRSSQTALLNKARQEMVEDRSAEELAQPQEGAEAAAA